jgi:hypothetical protein
MKPARRVLPLLPAMGLGTLLLSLATVSLAAEPSARDRHAAQCVAALEASADDLVRQVKAGQESARAPLMDRLTAGAAFIGDSYLHGDANEARARALVDEAEVAQRRLPAAELAARQSACAAEGARLVAQANALERAVLRRLAKKRMDRLLGA